jgi:hypothetical protein
MPLEDTRNFGGFVMIAINSSRPRPVEPDQALEAAVRYTVLEV